MYFGLAELCNVIGTKETKAHIFVKSREWDAQTTAHKNLNGQTTFIRLAIKTQILDDQQSADDGYTNSA